MKRSLEEISLSRVFGVEKLQQLMACWSKSKGAWTFHVPEGQIDGL